MTETEEITFQYTVKSLQPGFLVIRTDNPQYFTIKGWKEMLQNGWSGGLIIRDDQEIESYDEATMNKLGWVKATAERAAEKEEK